MTMDVSNRKSEDEVTPIKVVKRPFDVAFLMLPDDKIKQKQKKISDVDEEIEMKKQKQQIFDDPNIIKAKNFDELRKPVENPEQKSAFTKVNLRLSPNLSISPDLTYQNSLSPSPPISRNYQMLSPTQLFKNHQQINAYQNTFIPENFNPENQFMLKTPDLLQSNNFPKVRPMYRPELPYNYQPPEMRNPAAAAILTSLLPPSLAALSLPAQNVCAKCNISFRMTSDLVYHMRSHHKNDSVDMNKRRREEKLKCPVCSESFRERHHLTRHMTAHQDKDEDDEGSVKKKCVPNV